MGDDRLPTAYPGCVFCPGNGKVHIIAESNLAYAVMALNPPVDGCILVIPKHHIESYFELPTTWHAEERTVLWRLIRSGQMRTLSGYTPSWNLSKVGGQEIPHLHHWWIPRFDEDPESVAYHKGTATLVGFARQSSVLAQI